MTTSPAPAQSAPADGSPISSVTLYRGEAGEVGPLYTRLLSTDPAGPHRGAIFATYEHYRDTTSFGPAFPIWRSDDGGRTWSKVGAVTDTGLEVGNRYQPVLFELPRDFAGLAAGTLLLAGNAIPSDFSATNIVIYSSVDGGRTWEFRSVVDAGGPAVYDPSPDSTTTAVWEPFLDLIDDVLVCHYADERRKGEGALQALVHRTTRDLESWSDLAVDFATADRFQRPGMFVGTGRMPDGVFRAVFEIVGPREVPVHLACSTDGLDWGEPGDLGVRLIAEDGTALSGTPNIRWHDGGKRIAVIATGRVSLDEEGRVGNRALLNLNGGEGPWQSFELPIPAVRTLDQDSSGYSQSVIWAPDGNLVHATTVRNEASSHDVVVSVMAPHWM